MKSDGKYLGDIVAVLITIFFATFALWYGYYNTYSLFISCSVLLFILGLILHIESTGKRIRDDIVMELNGDKE